MPMETRASNGSKHPGEPDLRNANGQSPEEVQLAKRARAAKATAKDNKARAAANAVARIAKIEDNMVLQDERTENERVRMMPNNSKSKSKSKAPAKMQSNARLGKKAGDPREEVQPKTRREASSPLPLLETSESEADLPPKKKAKVTARDKVAQARQQPALTGRRLNPDLTEPEEDAEEEHQAKEKKKAAMKGAMEKNQGKGKEKAVAVPAAVSEDVVDFSQTIKSWYKKIPAQWEKPSGDNASARSSSTNKTTKTTSSGKTAASSGSGSSRRTASSSTAAHSTLDTTLSRKSQSSNASTSAKPAATSAVLPKANFTLGESDLLSDDENIEELHARSSPFKSAQPRKDNQNLVRVKDEPDSDGDDDRAGGSASQSLFKHLFKGGRSKGQLQDENPDLVDATPVPKAARKMRDMDVDIVDKAGKADDAEEPIATKRRRVQKMAPISEANEPKVKVEMEQPDLDDEELAKRTKIKMADLPPMALKNDRWRRRFVPTLLRYMGALETPWSVDEDDFRRAVELIWAAVYGTAAIKYDDDLHTVVRAVAMQSVYNWRSSFGSTAITALDAFFKSQKTYKDHGVRAKFAQWALKHHRFVYENAAGDDPKTYQGLFHSDFILRTFASHVSAIDGAIDVEGLFPGPHFDGDTKTVCLNRPIAAVGLASAAVERSLVLWRYHEVVWKNGRAAPKNKRVGGGDLTVAGDSYIGRSSAFGTNGWGVESKRFVGAASKLSQKKMDKIFDVTSTMLRLMRGAAAILISSDESNDEGFLVDNDPSDSE
ncbi:hypothetical protein B0H21DRAFT_711525 [Amylocystis lapponica]|nr:hypothetical protein B0H21DRAFT_711525 [Amylocystis lapponica]